MLLMNLESRPVVFEDIGRQVLANGQRQPPQYYIDEIGKFLIILKKSAVFIVDVFSRSFLCNFFLNLGKIKAEDIKRVADKMLRSKPALAALGNLKKLPSYEQIQQGLHDREGKMPRKFSIFR